MRPTGKAKRGKHPKGKEGRRTAATYWNKLMPEVWPVLYESHMVIDEKSRESVFVKPGLHLLTEMMVCDG